MMLRAVALGIAGFLIAATAVRLVLSAALADRLEIFARVKMAAADPQTDVVFIGTSRIQYGINPDSFDRRMAALGTATRSYNIGDSGLSLLESPQHLRELFDLAPCCIKYVFIEPDLSGLYVIRQPNTVRAIEFFSAENAYHATRFMESPLGREASAMSRPRYVWNIASGMARHYLNIGMAHADRDPGENWVTGIRGYPADSGLAHRTFSPNDKERASYSARLTTIAARLEQPRLASDYQVDIVLSLASYLRSKNAYLILLRPPQIAFVEYEAAVTANVRMLCDGQAPLVIDFSSPRAFSALFDPVNRFDDDHLNVSGADIFSTLIADRFAAALADGTVTKKPCRRS